MWVLWHGFTAMIVPGFVFLLIWILIGHTLAGSTGEITRFLTSLSKHFRFVFKTIVQVP